MNEEDVETYIQKIADEKSRDETKVKRIKAFLESSLNTAECERRQIELEGSDAVNRAFTRGEIHAYEQSLLKMQDLFPRLFEKQKSEDAEESEEELTE